MTERTYNAKVFRMFPDVELPTYATDEAACLDLRAYIPEADRAKGIVIYPGETVLIHTGLRFALPSGWELQIRPRSGMSLKTKFRVANSPGTIDADYRGEVCVISENTKSNLEPIFNSLISYFIKYPYSADVSISPERFFEAKRKEYRDENAIHINHGDRICQAKFAMAYRFGAAIPLIEVDTWDDGSTQRGAGGFGHTGTK